MSQKLNKRSTKTDQSMEAYRCFCGCTEPTRCSCNVNPGHMDNLFNANPIPPTRPFEYNRSMNTPT